MPNIDLNADAGESFGQWTLGQDEQLFPLLTSVNLALGFHAGDPVTLQQAVRLAAQRGLGIGAHPGYPDLVGFGRRELALTPGEIAAAVIYQVGALQGFLRAEGQPLQHVKAHGALYTRIHADTAAGDAFCAAVAQVAPEALLITLAGPAGESLRETAAQHGLGVWREAFPERAYLDSGELAPRSRPGSSIHDPQQAAQRALNMAQGQVETLDGGQIALQADTLCIHGDNPQAALIARAIHDRLGAAGVALRRP